MPLDLGDKKDKEKENEDSKKSLLDEGDLEDVNKIADMLNPDEKVLLVARQSKIKPGGSYLTPNTIYATDRRIIIRDPYMLGIKANVVDIPYDIITSLKLEKGLLSSTIRFKAVGLMSSTKLGMMDSIIEGEDDQTGTIEAIPKDKAEDLVEIIRSGMQAHKSAPSQKDTSYESVDQKDDISSSADESISVADELRKLAKLKEEGTLTEQEFNQMKQDLIKKNNI
jgi:PH (Pleckstrin Homology) domain-containing protein/putative oligomerization/nucleic acid binding protein